MTTYEFKCPECGNSKLIITMTNMTVERLFWFEDEYDYQIDDEYVEETAKTVLKFRCAGVKYIDGDFDHCGFVAPVNTYEELYEWAVREGNVR